MMSVEELVRKYLPTVNIIQLATSVSNQPWLCTVHYYSDKNLNLYWCSTLDRRHSREIKQNQQVAAYILIHENTPDEKYVIGISITGTAELIGENIDKQIGEAYVKKLGHKPEFLKEIASGKNQHKFYRLKPNKFVLFDSKNFSDNPRQEWTLV